jgi:hypothetical protein
LIEGFTKKYGVHRLVYSLNERCGALCMGPVSSAHGALRRRPARDDVGEGELLSTTVIPAPAASVARHSDVAMSAGPEIARTPKSGPPASRYVGVFAFRNVRRWRTANGTRSFASFHGKNVICAFGASIAVSSATA